MPDRKDKLWPAGANTGPSKPLYSGNGAIQTSQKPNADSQTGDKR
ncbi:hypothetical protein ACIBHY_53945 [Nonomuraea sp. NPDC050547]